MLVDHFLVRFNQKLKKQVKRLDAEAMSRLRAHSWPGNIRELENVIERAMILSTGRELELGAQLLDAPEAQSRTPAAHVTTSVAEGASDAPTLEDVQRQHILRALQQCAWVIDGPRGAARVLGLNPNTLRSRMKKLGIRRSNEEQAG